MGDIMPVSEVIDRVAAICKANGVERLDLFGSFATGTAVPTSDIDFVVYGCKDILGLEEAILEIDTLRKIDIFDYNSIHNEFLLEDIKKYGKQIYETLQYKINCLPNAALVFIIPFRIFSYKEGN